MNGPPGDPEHVSRDLKNIFSEKIKMEEGSICRKTQPSWSSGIYNLRDL